MKLSLVWYLAAIVNGLITFPNLVGLLALSAGIISETRKYFASDLERSMDVTDSKKWDDKNLSGRGDKCWLIALLKRPYRQILFRL